MASDHYATLRIRSHATEDEIRDAYLRCARQYHPDLNSQDPAAEKRFKQIRLAYEILSNCHTRVQYDRNRKALDNTTVVYATGRCHPRPNTFSVDAKVHGGQTRRPSSVRFDTFHRSGQSRSSRMWSLIAVAVCVGMILGALAALAYQQRRAADWRLEIAKALRESSKQTSRDSADRIGHGDSRKTTAVPRPTPPAASSDAAVGSPRDVAESASSTAKRDEKPSVQPQSDDSFPSDTPTVRPSYGGVYKDLGASPDAAYGVSNESHPRLPFAGDGRLPSAIPSGAADRVFRTMNHATFPSHLGDDATSSFWPDSPMPRTMRTEVATSRNSALFSFERERHLDVVVGASPAINARMGVPYRSGPTTPSRVGGMRSLELETRTNGAAWDGPGRRPPGHSPQFAGVGRSVWPRLRPTTYPGNSRPGVDMFPSGTDDMPSANAGIPAQRFGENPSNGMPRTGLKMGFTAATQPTVSSIDVENGDQRLGNVRQSYPARYSPYGYTTPPTGTYSVVRPGGVLGGVGNAPFAVWPGGRRYNSASAFSSGFGVATSFTPY